MGDQEQATVSVRLLGGVQVVGGDGSIVELPSASQRRLLAILALHSPRHLRSERLADLLGIHTGALRTTVSRLRTTVGVMLETASTGYGLVAEVDADRFCRAVGDAADADDRVDALQRALASWNGPPLEEFAGEEWADGEIARLTEIHAATVDDLADGLIEGRRATEAVALLQSQVATYPYRDRPRGLLIRALASEGRQADALRAFQHYRELLIEELGTEPSPDVVRIERRVATGWNGIDAASDDDRRPDGDDAGAGLDLPVPAALNRTGRFVGRVDELALLHSELTLTATTGLRGVVLDGEPGIGKTTLLAAFAQSVAAAASATVTYGRCDESGVPLQPFLTVLNACVEHAPVHLLNDHVARHGGELVRICPLLAMRVPTAPAPTSSDDATARFLAFEAATDLLRRIAESRPLVMLLDDVQWAEPTALLLLAHLTRALADAPVLLVVCSRDAEPDVSDARRASLADLDRADTRRLDLTGFDEADLDDLVFGSGTITVDRERALVVAALGAQTAGNPLYATQLIRHWSEAGFEPDAVPPSLRDVVWRRIHALGEDTTKVLTAAAVLGLEFDVDVLLEMVGLPEPVVLGSVDAAARGGLVLDAGSARQSLRFVHALVANALVTDIGPAQRARLHGLAARALEKAVDDSQPEVAGQLAQHCALAGWPAEAQRWWTRAGDDALEHLALAEAAQHFRAALDLAIELDRPGAERADLLVRLGDAQHRSGDAHAFDTLQAGAALAQQSGADPVLIRAALAADRGFMRLDERAPEFLALVEAAVAVAHPADVATNARLRALLAQSLMYTPSSERRLALAHEALTLAEGDEDPTLLVQIAPPVLFALWGPGSRDLRSRVAARAIRAAERTGDPRLEFSAHLSAYNIAIEAADRAVAARSLAQLRATERRLGEPRLRYVVGFYDTFEATMAGRLEEAETLATANLELGSEIGAPDAFAAFAGQLFVIGTFAGRHAELFPLVEQASIDNPGVFPFRLAYGIICCSVGREDLAHDVLHEGLATDFGDVAVDNFWMTSIIGYAVLAIETDDAEAAAHLLPLIEPFARDVAFNGATSQGPVAAYAGKLASLMGQHEPAEQHLLAALEIATAFGWSYHHASTLFALAQNRHRESGVVDTESEGWLRDAAELCRAGGYRSWLARIETLAGTS